MNALSLFFSPSETDVVRALRICGECTVRAECLTYALSDTGINDGIWGGYEGHRLQSFRDGWSVTPPDFDGCECLIPNRPTIARKYAERHRTGSLGGGPTPPCEESLSAETRWKERRSGKTR